MTSIELLAPARTALIGKEAIVHGADAVYIGGPRFGARAEATNSIDDIRDLCAFAHRYGARVYGAINTIIFDHELAQAKDVALAMRDAGCDALIVQDHCFRAMQLGIPLHASTQMDNRTPEKLRMLSAMGYEQAVVARELTLEETLKLHTAVPEMRLEAFVHGAICVAYNGRCYASWHLFRRSANRGECAQFCRLPFDLIDAEGRTIARNQHLLSLRDMNRSDHLEDMMDAGITSFKIEGRLKDVAYVKNTVAHYRRCIDAVVARRPQDFCRSSLGSVRLSFEPRIEATFNRGYTPYFLHGRTPDMASTLSPKSLGEEVGSVRSVSGRELSVSSAMQFAPGDGFCYVDARGALQGFRINRAEGQRLFLSQRPEGLRPGTTLRRNHDQRFTQLLAKPTAERRIGLRWTLSETHDGFRLSANGVGIERQCDHTPALAPQGESIRRTLSRLGATAYEATHVDIRTTAEWFIPASTLTAWRNDVIALLPSPFAPQAPAVRPCSFTLGEGERTLTYEANVANALAAEALRQLGAQHIEPAMEVRAPERRPLVLMTTRYCVKHQLGLCRQSTGPLLLRLADGRRFPLRFHCRECFMEVLAE